MPQVNRLLLSAAKVGVSVGTATLFLVIVGVPGEYNLALRYWPDLRTRFQMLLPLVLFALLAIDHWRMGVGKPFVVYCARGLVAGGIAAFLALHTTELMAPAGLEKMLNSYSASWSSALAAQLWHGFLGTFGWLYGFLSGGILWLIDRYWRREGQSLSSGGSSEVPQPSK